MHRWYPSQPLLPQLANPVNPANRITPFNAAYRPFPRTTATDRATTKVTRRTVVIFDWDDTLFPTSEVVEKSDSNITIGDLYILGKSVYQLLGTYISTFGAKNIFIVTNGSKNWILDSLKELSRMYKDSFDALPGDTADAESTQKMRGKDFFAAIYNSFISLRIPLLSARSAYSDRHPQRASLWKVLMFKSIVKSHFNLFSGRDGNLYVIISIGDSKDEFDAALEAKRMAVTQNRLNCNDNVVLLHRVKLMERPNIQQMVKQHAALRKEAPVLFAARESVTIRHVDVQKWVSI